MDFRVDVLELLELLHIENVGIHGDEAVFSCPFPGHKHGDSSPSASMNTNNTAWLCFGCQRKGNAATFVAELEETTIFTARKWLRDYFDGGFREPIGAFATELDDMFSDPTIPELREVNPTIGEEWVDEFAIDWEMVLSSPEIALGIPGLTYILERGFDAQTLMDADVGYDAKEERVVLPVRNLDGEVIGLKGRATRAGQQPRYRVYGSGRFPFKPYSTSEVIYLANRAKESESRQIIICEGELNALRMHQYGYDNAVGMSGATFSRAHADIICSIADSVVIYFDSDKAGMTGASGAISMLLPRIPVSVVPPHQNDAADSRKEEVDELIALAQSALDPTNTFLTQEGVA